MTPPPNHNTADQSGADERAKDAVIAVDKMLSDADDYQALRQGIVDLVLRLASTQPAPQAAQEPIAWMITACGEVALHKQRLPIAGNWTPLYATPQPLPAPAVQSGELPAPRRYFHTLPLGTAFSYIGSGEKWIVLETHGCGLVAKYAHHDSNKPLQQICSFEDSEYAAQHTEVDVVPLEAIAQTAPAVAGEAIRNAVLEEAATLCHDRFILRMNGGFPREASTARMLAVEIRALKTAAPSQGAKQ